MYMQHDIASITFNVIIGNDICRNNLECNQFHNHIYICNNNSDVL